MSDNYLQMSRLTLDRIAWFASLGALIFAGFGWWRAMAMCLVTFAYHAFVILESRR